MDKDEELAAAFEEWAGQEPDITPFGGRLLADGATRIRTLAAEARRLAERVAELEKGHNDLWGQWQGLSAKLTAAEAEARRLRGALENIGNGCTGRVARDHLACCVARAALAEEQDNG